MQIAFDKNLSRTELARALGIGRVTLWRLQRDGLLPAPARVNGQRVEYTPELQMIAADLVAGSRA